MRSYVLPELGYDYGALEPAISGEIMELHHGAHHAAYVRGANQAMEQLRDARERRDLTALPGLERAFAFNLSGHALHSIFWRNLSPEGGDRPDGELAAALDESFGGFDAWEHAFYLQYRNVKADYVERLWSIVDWGDVGRRFDGARAGTLTGLTVGGERL